MPQKHPQNESSDPTLNYFVFYTIFYSLGRLTSVLKKSLTERLATFAKRRKNANPQMMSKPGATPACVCQSKLSAHEREDRYLGVSEFSNPMYGMPGENEDISPAITIQYEDWLATLIPEQIDCFEEKSLAMTHHHDFINP